MSKTALFKKVTIMEETTPVESQIDDILARSMRLQRKNPYVVNYSLQNVLNASRIVINTRDFSEEDSTRGKYLLGLNAHYNFEISQNLLSEIDTSHVVSKIPASYAEQSRAAFQTITIKSITATQAITYEMNDEIIMEAIKNKKQVHSRPPASVPYHEDKNLTPSLREYLRTIRPHGMHLRAKDQFYADLLQVQNTEKLTQQFSCVDKKISQRYAKRIADAIMRSEESTKKVFKENEKETLAGTYMLIDCQRHPRGSLRYLEKQKKHALIKEVNTNLKSAGRSGIYGICETIKGYINLIGHPQGNSPWAVLFYAMRIGKYKDALEYANSGATGSFDYAVISALEARVREEEARKYGNKTEAMPDQIREALAAQLANEKVSKYCDTFKALSLSVLSRVSGYRDQTILNTFEDWLWYSFHFKDKARLAAQVQKTKFDDPQNPLLAGQALMLVHKYEEAAKWFLDTPEAANDGLEIAFAMHVTGLIDEKVFMNDLLDYVVDVFQADHKIALAYISLLRSREARVEAIANICVRANDGEEIFSPEVRTSYVNLFAPDTLASAIQFDGVSTEYPVQEEELHNDQEIADAPVATLSVPQKDLEDAIGRSIEFALERNEYRTAIRLSGILGDHNRMLDICAISLKHFIYIQSEFNRKEDEDLNKEAIILCEEVLDQLARFEVDSMKLEVTTILLHFAKAKYFAKMGNALDTTFETEASGIFPTSLEAMSGEAPRLIIEKYSQYISKDIFADIINNAINAYNEVLMRNPADTNVEEKIRCLEIIRGKLH